MRIFQSFLRHRCVLVAVATLLTLATTRSAENPPPAKIIFDTDIGNDVDDLLGELIEVEDGRIRVQADGMELVAILQIQRRVPS